MTRRRPPDRASTFRTGPHRTPAGARVSGNVRRNSHRLLLLSAAAAIAAPVWGQVWTFEPSISLQGTATNNVSLAPSDERTSDFVTQISPALSVSERGDRTKLEGFVSVPVLLYARTGAENNYVAPSASLIGDVNFFDKLLYVEGAVSISQQFFNPFGAQPVDLASATDNRYRSTVYRVSPYLQGVTTNGIAYGLRNNNVWANLSGAPGNADNSRYTEWFANMSTPARGQFGLDANYDYTDVTFAGQDQGSLQTQIGRLVPFWNVDPQLRIGASIGYERNDGVLTNYSGTVYGAGLEWRPTERTKVVAKWEQRYFGSSYIFTFDHRSRLTVWNFNASRNVTTYPQQLGSLQAGTNVPGYLNQLFLSSIPDDIARQQTVDQFMQDRGLPQTLAGPVTLYGDQLVLQQQAYASVGLIGVRNSIFFSAFTVQSEPITAAGTALPPSLFSTNDNTQIGGSVAWNNRLTQAVNLSATFTAMRTTANEPLPGRTDQGYAQITLSAPWTPRSSGFIAARYQALSSNVASDYIEAAVLFGVSYALR